MFEIKRIAVELVIIGVLFTLFIGGSYASFSAPVQLIFMKMVLTSLGFTHAHIMRKLVFPTIRWQEKEDSHLQILIIVLYAVFVLAYAIGG